MEESTPTDQRSLDAQSNAETASLEETDEPPDGSCTPESSSRLSEEFESGHISETLKGDKTGWSLKSLLKQAKDLVWNDRINVLLVFVPVGIALGFVDADPIAVFILNALAIIPLAIVISSATECLASRLGDTFGALLNVTVGNTAELIIFFTALAKDQIRIVQASLLGSILANSLLVLGTANLCGGLRFRHGLYDRVAGRLSVVLLDFGLVISTLPVAIFASTQHVEARMITTSVLTISRGISFGLIVLYVLYLLLQLRLQSSQRKRESSTTDIDEHDDEVLPTLHPTASHGHVVPHHSQSFGASPTTPFPTRFRSLSIANTGFDSRHRNWSNSISKLRSKLATTWSGNYFSHQDGHRNGGYVKLDNLQHFSLAEDSPRSSITDRNLNSMNPSDKQSVDPKSNIKKLPYRHSNLEASITEKSVDSTLFDHGLKIAAQASSLPPSPPSTPDNDSVGDAGILETRNLLRKPKGRPLRPANSQGRLERLPTPSSRALQNTLSPPHMPHGAHLDRKLRTPLAVAILVLVLTTGVAAVCTELAVDKIPTIVDSWGISNSFIGFIVLPFVGNAAEHVTAAKMALRNKMVLAKSVAVESATQVVLFIMPAIVLLGWLRGRRMSLQFDLFEVGCILVTAVAVSSVICFGKSSWKQGAALHAIYLMFALAAVFYRETSGDGH